MTHCTRYQRRGTPSQMAFQNHHILSTVLVPALNALTINRFQPNVPRFWNTAPGDSRNDLVGPDSLGD